MSQTVDLEQWWYTKHPDKFGNVHFLIVLNDYLFYLNDYLFYLKWLFHNKKLQNTIQYYLNLKNI